MAGEVSAATTQAPGFWDQMLHSPPSKLDTGMHAGSLALNASFAGWAIYKLATDKHDSMAGQLGYVALIGLNTLISAADLQRLIFHYRINQGHPKSIQQAEKIRKYYVDQLHKPTVSLRA